MYELDDRLILYLTHSNLSNQGRGLREGAMVEISNAHMLKIATPLYKVRSKLIVLIEDSPIVVCLFCRKCQGLSVVHSVELKWFISQRETHISRSQTHTFVHMFSSYWG